MKLLLIDGNSVLFRGFYATCYGNIMKTSFGVYTNAEPIVYYFKNEYSKDDVEEISSHVEEYCGNNDIAFNVIENSCFEE